MLQLDQLTGVRRGDANAPFVTVLPGVAMQLHHVDVDAGFYSVTYRILPNARTPTHKHTGHVFGFTTAGRWKYREYDDTFEAGSYLYEPAGSIHTFEPLGGETVVASFVVHGANLEYDEEGQIAQVVDASLVAQAYLHLCDQQGKVRPNVVGL